MTTLIALATTDAIVVDTDSLGTVTRSMVNPWQLFQYFDPANGFKLKLKPDGTPQLSEFSQILNDSESIPYKQLLHVNKLFKLGTLPIAVMFTGAISLGDYTIRGVISEFVNQDPSVKN